MPSDRTVLCCRGRCPGDAMMCGQPLNVEWPEVCYDGQQANMMTDDVNDAAEPTTQPDAGIALKPETQSDASLPMADMSPAVSQPDAHMGFKPADVRS